jgi:hypothetical protein
MAEGHPEQMPEGFDPRTAEYRVAYVGKDSFGMLSFDIGPEWAQIAKDRILLLNRALDSGVAPECTCEDWQVEYCSFSELEEYDDKTVSFSCCRGQGQQTRKRKATDKF